MRLSTHASVAAPVSLLSSLDEDGFLTDPQQWTPELANQLAAAAELPQLGETHLKTILFIREKYLTLGAIPPMRQTCRRIGLSKYEVKHLFGGCRQLWQIAGLPNPGSEALTYMD